MNQLNALSNRSLSASSTMMANIKLTQQVLEEMAGAPVVLIDRSVLPHEEILARQYTAVQVELTERQLTERVAAINIQITQDGRIPLIDGDRANAFASRIEAACIVWSYRNVSEVEKNKAGSSKILLSSPEDLPTPNFMTHIHGSVILPDLQMMNAKEHWCSYSRLFGETQPEVESDRSISLLHEIQHLLQPFRASQIIAPVGLYSSELHAEAHALLKARELGIKEEAITARLAARSTAAFIGPCPQEYWLTPGCVAALNDLPQPQYADIVWAMHEIHYRVSLRHSNQMMANDSSTLREHIQEQHHLVDVTQKNYTFNYNFSGNKFCDVPHHYFALLAKELTQPYITDQLTRAWSNDIMDSYGLFCPTAAAEAIRDSGAPQYFNLRTTAHP